LVAFAYSDQLLRGECGYERVKCGYNHTEH